MSTQNYYISFQFDHGAEKETSGSCLKDCELDIRKFVFANRTVYKWN